MQYYGLAFVTLLNGALFLTLGRQFLYILKVNENQLNSAQG